MSKSNGIRSREHKINVIKTPAVTDFEMQLNYPNYTLKRSENIQNTGNAIIPEGTQVTWNISTKETDSIHFITKLTRGLYKRRVRSIFFDKTNSK